MTQSITILSMFFLGLTGCGHCIGMCGPLVFAFPGKTGKLSGHLFYHSGRIFAYTLTGGFISFGSGVLFNLMSSQSSDPLKSMFQVQIALSLFSALLLLFFGLLRIGIFREPGWLTASIIPGFSRLTQKALQGKKHQHPGIMLYVGFLMGFLPCGLTYAAFSRVLSVSHIFNGAIYMLFFGLGTLPALLIIGHGASSLIRRYRKETELFSGVLMIGMAVSLLVKAFQTLTP